MIKFLCTVDGEVLYFAVLNQDESQRRGNDEEAIYYTRKLSNGLMVISNESPRIAHLIDYIFVRGSEYEYDNKLTSVKFPSNADALAYRDKIIEALEEWSRLGGFEKNPGAARSYCQDKAVFTF